MSMNIETAKEVRNTLMWAALIEEVDIKIAYEASKLRTCKPEDLRSIQDRIDVYESIKRIPQDVIDREELPT